MGAVRHVEAAMESFKSVRGLAWVAAGVIGFCMQVQRTHADWVLETETRVMRNASEGESAPPAQKATSTLKLRGKALRVDKGKTSVITLESGDVLTLVHPMKTCMVARLEDMKALREKVGEKPGLELPKPVATGKTDTISGYKVAEYVAKQPDRTMTYWVIVDEDASTKKLRETMGEVYGKIPSNTQANVDYRSLAGFPIVIEMERPARLLTKADGSTLRDAGGKSVVTVKSIKEVELDAGLFSKPVDYEEMEVPKVEAKEGK